MPITAELRRDLYNTGPWLKLRDELRDVRAGGRCECAGECGRKHGAPGARCAHVHGAPAVEQSGTVILGVAHRHQSETGKMVSADRLIVMCQGCHLRYDMDSHLESRRRNRWRKMVRQYGQQDLFTGEANTPI